MGLKNDLLTDLNEAFDTDLADAVRSFTGIKISTVDGDFDPSTGINAPTEQSATMRGVFSRVTKKDIDVYGAITKTSKLIVLSSEFTTAGFQIGTGDKVEVDSENYTIYDVKVDPADVSYTLFVKRSN